jgi:hypothetical protein
VHDYKARKIFLEMAKTYEKLAGKSKDGKNT